MRIPRSLSLALVASALATFTPAQAQNTGFAITSIDISLEATPVYNLSIGPQRKATSQDWMMIETTFAYEPQERGVDPFLDELTFNYYVLLGNKSREYPQGTLLAGSVTHVAVGPGKDLHSVAFVSPRTLTRYFLGKPPSSKQSATQAIGVTITRQGQVVAEDSIGLGKGKPQWWNQFQQTPGYVLNKNETPFAPLFWDYYEALQSTPGR
ncbi:MAG: Amuc_1102 family pilus-like protein [Chthoniobacterales bacterium]